jgi:hypothetical protein
MDERCKKNLKQNRKSIYLFRSLCELFLESLKAAKICYKWTD